MIAHAGHRRFPLGAAFEEAARRVQMHGNAALIDARSHPCAVPFVEALGCIESPAIGSGEALCSLLGEPEHIRTDSVVDRGEVSVCGRDGNTGDVGEIGEATRCAEFVAALDAVNLIAERTPGFVWRLRDEDGQSSSYVTAYDDPLVIVNLTVWQDITSLRHFTYKSGHGAYLRRRREWFEAPSQPHMVCWWVPVGEVPTVADATRRLDGLRADGPGPEGFLFTDPLAVPSDIVKP